MSGALQAISGVGGIATSALRATGLMPAMFGAQRKIGTIIPDVTIEENLSDRLTVTQHPIADGSPVNDHAYKLPATITMRLGFTNVVNVGGVIGGAVSSVIGGGSIGGALSGAGSSLLSSATEQRTVEIYKQLVKLQFDQDAWNKHQRPLMPFKLTTGKRTYDNVVITELSVRTDRTTEYSLMIEVHMQEVFLVKTQSTTQPAQTDQADPKKTASPTDQSDKKPETPTTDSGSNPPTLLTRTMGGIGEALKNIGGKLGYGGGGVARPPTSGGSMYVNAVRNPAFRFTPAIRHSAAERA